MQKIETIIKNIQDNISKTIKSTHIDIETLDYLNNLYMPDLDRKTFAMYLLELTPNQYEKIIQGKKVIIFKKEKKDPKIIKRKYNEEFLDLINKLKKLGYANKEVTYSVFLNIYEEYGTCLSEKEFAEQVLGVRYIDIKRDKCKTIILKPSNNINYLEIDNIRQKIKLKYGSPFNIDYNIFSNIFSNYPLDLEEWIYAKLVLNIPYTSFKTMKYSNGKTFAFNEKVELNANDIDYLYQQFLQLYPDKLYEYVSYEEFSDIHKHIAPNSSESEFALKVLGISYDSYKMMKFNKNRAKICNYKIKKLTTLIKKIYFKHSKNYSFEYIEKICKLNNLSIDDFIIYIITNLNFKFLDLYKKKLLESNTIFIGTCKISKESQEKYYTLINDIIEFIINCLYKQHHEYFYVRENLNNSKTKLYIYFVENYGDIFINFKDNQDVIRAILFRSGLKKLNGDIMLSYSKGKNIIEFNDNISYNANEISYENEFETLDIIRQKKRILKLFKKYLSLGYSDNKALSLTCQKLKLSKENLKTIYEY